MAIDESGDQANGLKEQLSPENSEEVSHLPVSVENSESYLATLNHYLSLSLSIPERSARALSALVGGSTLLLSKTLIPSAIKSTASYKFTLGMFQTFLIRNLAGVNNVSHEMELKDNFIHRKMLGTSLEAAGLLTMHLSPVWVFAIASDAAKGGQVFLQRLVHYLKENEVISKDSNPASLEQILQSIEEMGRQGATAIDTPPLSKVEIVELADELRASTSNLAGNSANLIPRFESIWDQISQVAKKENLSMEQVLGMLSVHAGSIAETGIGTAGAVGKTGYTILDEVLLNDYKNTLADITEDGALAYMKNNMQPYVENAQSHFDFKQETWTQRWFKTAIRKFSEKLRS
ncbi:MAG: hypothetical protein OXU66_07170 [Gammaproteobacteria bacterium]|nr:hypothetical protein [Gammaproteobacteria bacterium]MDD9896723.1 hypothetical protein [Gammaproteobacteria bacterium]MDD9958705.1 hypothetical protein [Gammaproteobacteria bacterium]